MQISHLREEVAAQWTTAYGGAVDPACVAITQGCNQAFCAAIASVVPSTSGSAAESHDMSWPGPAMNPSSVVAV